MVIARGQDRAYPKCSIRLTYVWDIAQTGGKAIPQASPVTMPAGLQRPASTARSVVRHHDHRCLCACSTLSSSGSGAGPGRSALAWVACPVLFCQRG